jgi:hypothetical protein
MYLESLDKRWEREVALGQAPVPAVKPAASKGQKAPGMPKRADLQSAPKLVLR